MGCNARARLLLGLLAPSLFLFHNVNLLAQTETTKAKQANPAVSCEIRAEHRAWKPNEPAIVFVTIESNSDRALSIPLWAILSLDPATLTAPPRLGPKISGKLDAAVDPTLTEPLISPSSATITRAKRDGSVRFGFAHHGEKAIFKLDARDLIWDFEALNRAPTLKLFSVAKPGAYDLQFEMNWESGSCTSAKIRLTLSNQ